MIAPLNASIFEPTPAVTFRWSSVLIEPFGGCINGSRGSKEFKMFGLLIFSLF